MHECCLNFLGAGIETAEGRAFSLEVLAPHAREAPGIPGRDGPALQPRGHARRVDELPPRQARQGEVARRSSLGSRRTDEPYYTNSSQLPVGFTSDIFDALDHQEELQASYTGGTVFHVFLGEAPEDWRPVRDLVKAIASGYRVPYYTISPTFSICPVHGYLAGRALRLPALQGREGGEDPGRDTDAGSRVGGHYIEVGSFAQRAKLQSQARRSRA